MRDDDIIAGYEVELGYPLGDSYLGSALKNSDLEIVFVPGVPVSSGPVPYFTVHGSDADVVEDVLQSHSDVEEFELVSSGSDGRLYRCQWKLQDGGIVSTIQAHDGIVREMVGTNEGWVVSVFFPTNEHAAKFHDACLDRRLEIDIRRVEPSRIDGHPPVNDGLSEKQLTALELAFSRGYFETPKEASLTEIADDLGISEQALSQRLRRALNRLVASSVDDAVRGRSRSK
ncbi:MULTISPECIES: helix-turn-helix domain-containing protein [Haloferax]|uniref:DNA-binding protein n=2 Tax=Haloferax TaxID=2251 RepID=A0A6G1Z0F3_9EURY|nr:MULTISPECIES: helix-turn-helix domain-containing protein [Haloferax]KAB1187274.1 DNA-binding protein [Haloferax sp. CBA1149]MRW79918.1 DNA-binding protein [Haloferax marinisediminis]